MSRDINNNEECTFIIITGVLPPPTATKRVFKMDDLCFIWDKVLATTVKNDK